ADDGEPRAYLRGVHLVPGMVWCSDGVHIATARIDYDGPAVVLPAQPVRGLLEVLQEGATVEVEAAGRQARRLRVTSGHRQSTVRLLDTSPIDIAGLIARTRSQAPGITVRRTELAAAIRRFMPFAMVPGETPKKALPTLILQLQGGELTLADRAEESVESLEGALVAGEGKWRAGLNPRQLLDALSAIGGEVVQIEPPAANPEDRSYQGV